MKHFLVLAFAAAIGCLAQTTTITPISGETEGNSTRETNVNSRYTVESVGIDNLRHYHVSKSLLEDMQDLVGRHFSTERFQNLAERISEELHGHQVVFKLSRGTDPDHVRVTFEVHAPRTGLDVEVPRLLYTSKEGFTAEGDVLLNVGANRFTFGLLSDGDSMVERASGIRAKYDRLAVGSERVRLSFEFDSYHDQYDRATENAVANETAGSDASLLYRSRQNFEPSATVKLAGPLTWIFGLSFQQFHEQVPAAGTQSSNAIDTTLRYDRQWENSGSSRHRLSASYSLRAATSFLGSAFAYTRHAVDATYHWRHGHQTAEASFLAGAVAGNAPLYDRFVLGTSTTLRGWDKYSLDPLGANRVLYGSAGYGYRMLRTFYDTGAIWDTGTKRHLKQSAGIGVKVEGVLFAVAFPFRSGSMEPVFIAGMNF